MVDIETTGTDPAHAAIIQIAAVGFSLSDKTVYTERMYDRCLIPPANRFWDESTRSWWQKHSPVLEGIMPRMEDSQAVMNNFHSWLMEFGHVRLWAKPTSFESPFLESYFRQFGLQNPFKYYESVDLNSYIRGRGHDRDVFWKEIPFEGPEHNALFDVLHQIKGAFSA